MERYFIEMINGYGGGLKMEDLKSLGSLYKYIWDIYIIESSLEKASPPVLPEFPLRQGPLNKCKMCFKLASVGQERFRYKKYVFRTRDRHFGSMFFQDRIMGLS